MSDHKNIKSRLRYDTLFMMKIFLFLNTFYLDFANENSLSDETRIEAFFEEIIIKIVLNNNQSGYIFIYASEPNTKNSLAVSLYEMLLHFRRNIICYESPEIRNLFSRIIYKISVYIEHTYVEKKKQLKKTHSGNISKTDTHGQIFYLKKLIKYIILKCELSTTKQQHIVEPAVHHIKHKFHSIVNKDVKVSFLFDAIDKDNLVIMNCSFPVIISIIHSFVDMDKCSKKRVFISFRLFDHLTDVFLASYKSFEKEDYQVNGNNVIHLIIFVYKIYDQWARELEIFDSLVLNRLQALNMWYSQNQDHKTTFFILEYEDVLILSIIEFLFSKNFVDSKLLVVLPHLILKFHKKATQKICTLINDLSSGCFKFDYSVSNKPSRSCIFIYRKSQ